MQNNIRNSENKIAVLGGAFDPPHLAHIEMADACIAEFGYEKIIFLPSYNPPHKRVNCKARDRLNMLKLAIEGRDRFEISEFEIFRDSVGYTADTLPALKEIIGDFDFVVGGDSVRDMHTWYRPDRVLAENNIIVSVRDGDEKTVTDAIARFNTPVKSIRLLKTVPQSISSSDIRLLIETGEDYSQYVDSKVAEYIKSHGLYGQFDGMRERVKARLSPPRYAHTISTVKTAVKLGKKLKLDYDKVFIAALLHDCAKEYEEYSLFDIDENAKNTPIAHALAGAIEAREYGVNDKEIQDAIRYHSTGRADMTMLDKVIFVADMIEESRTFDGADELRRAVYADFEEGFKECLKRTYEHLKQKGADIYYLTEEAYLYYIKNN